MSLLDKVRSKISQDKQTDKEPVVFDVDMTDDGEFLKQTCGSDHVNFTSHFTETSEITTNNADKNATPCDLSRQSNEQSERENRLFVSSKGCPAAAGTTGSNHDEVQIVYEHGIKQEPPDIMESTLESDTQQNGMRPHRYI